MPKIMDEVLAFVNHYTESNGYITDKRFRDRTSKKRPFGNPEHIKPGFVELAHALDRLRNKTEERVKNNKLLF